MTLNDTLAGYTDPTPAVAAHARANFETDWNRYNLIRTIAITSSFGMHRVRSAHHTRKATVTPTLRQQESAHTVGFAARSLAREGGHYRRLDGSPSER